MRPLKNIDAAASARDGALGALRISARFARTHFALSTGALWASLILAHLFIGGAIGMADNFDGHRLMCQLGVAPDPIPASQPLWAYLTPHYSRYTWYGEACSAGGSGQPYLSTEYVPLWIAKQLTGLFGPPGALDLRMLGIVFALAAGAAVGWTARELPGPRWARVLIASAIGLAADDSAIAPYYISPLSEPAALLGMLLLIPATLRLLGREHVRARDICAVAAITAWTIGAKTQMASLLIVAVPVLLLRPWARYGGRPGHGRGASRILLAVAGRAPALVACTFMVAATAEFQEHQSRWMSEIVLYDDVFRDVLGHSPDVPADLRALHLPANFASAAGSTVVSANSAAALPDYPAFLRNESLGRVLGFYAEHPGRLFGLAGRGLAGVSATRPGYLGNYQASSGAAPYARECRVCVATATFTLAQPFRWLAIPGLWIVALAGGIHVARRRRAPARARGLGVVLAAMSAATIAQFWAVMLTEGDSDIQKHMVFAVFGTMLLGPLLAAAVVAADQERRPVAVEPGAAAPDAQDLIPNRRADTAEPAVEAVERSSKPFA